VLLLHKQRSTLQTLLTPFSEGPLALRGPVVNLKLAIRHLAPRHYVLNCIRLQHNTMFKVGGNNCTAPKLKAVLQDLNQFAQTVAVGW
jgi:hypothetical protein